MKKLFAILLLALPFMVFAQGQHTKKAAPKGKVAKTFPIDSLTGKITYYDSASLAGRTKDQLHSRMKNLTADTKNIIKDDVAKGIFQYKGSVSVAYPSPMIGITHKGTVNYVVTFTYKEGFYEYKITEFIHKGAEADGGPLEGKNAACDKYILTGAGWAAIKTQTMAAMDALVPAIATTMKTP
ncbi:MAG: hypothetical protein RLZZ175_2134 [Bacteroidota bacterium]|jgi:hypothetical protein